MSRRSHGQAPSPPITPPHPPGTRLQLLGALHREWLNIRRLFGMGIMHAKFFVVDQRHFYLGSANVDWRSMNQAGTIEPAGSTQSTSSIGKVLDI
ncbi:unnamed protein product [Sphagnum balticum]